ncbi:MAG: DMT family transporter [Syntrophales bacterium]|nr:DMT family transporter [Syntrophales bacterium]
MAEGREARTGYLLAALAALFWASSGTAAKYLFINGITAFELVQMRTTLAAGLILGWLAFRDRSLLAVERRDLPYFITLGVGLAVVQFTYLFAISKIQVAAAILIQYQAPLFVALYTLFFLGTKLPPIVFAAMAGSLFGCWLVVGGYNLDLLHMNRVGLLSALASAVTFAWYTVRCEYGMKRYPPWTVVFYGLLFAAVTWNILHPPLSGFLKPSGAAQWGCVLVVGFLGTVLAFICYNEGINRIGATRASITATLEPITAGFIAWLFLGETMELWQVLGAAFVIASITALQLSSRQAEKG